MKKNKSTISKRLFICTHERKDKECCFKKNSNQLISELKDYLKKNNLWSKYKITKSGCLGRCSEGIAALLYPENLEISEINLKSVDSIKDIFSN